MSRVRALAPLVILFILVIAGASYAQQAAKIAIVNSARALETSVEGKRITAQLQDRQNKIKTDLQKMDDSIRLLENRLSTGRLTMTPDALQGIQADIDKQATVRKRYEEDQAREFNQYSASLVQKIRDEMVTIIENLSKERGFDLVLDLGASGVVTFSPAIDITDEVIRRYDQSKTTAPPPVKK